MKSEYANGLNDMRRGDYAGAERHFRAALAANPEDPHAMIELLYARSRQRNRLITFGLMRNALRLAPNDVHVFAVAARIHLATGKVSAALVKLRSALRLNPESSEIHALVALCYLSLRNRKQCLASLHAALALNPRCAVALDVKRQFAQRMGSPADAEKAARSNLSADPENPQAHTAMGKAKLKEGDVAQGYWHYREALRLQPHSKEAMSGVVESLRHRNPIYSWAYRNGLYLVHENPGYAALFFFLLLQASGALGRNLSGGPALVILLVALCPVVVLLAIIVLPMPIVHLVTRLHPVARHCLIGSEKAEMALTCLFASSALICGTLYFRTHLPSYLLGVLVAANCYAAHGLLLTFFFRLMESGA